jgi:hypothetical protein
VPAFAINASAILPSRCAFLPSSVSKYQNSKVEVPICHPLPIYCFWLVQTSGNALLKCGNFLFFSGLASSRANKAYFSIVFFFRI